MNMPSYAYIQILKKHKITTLLESKGVFPVGGEQGGRLKYKCPIHGDTNPSLVVYLYTHEYETYFCFGCKSGINIINLYSALENVSIREAIKRLSEGLEINIESELGHIVDECLAQTKEEKFNPLAINMLINRTLYDFKDATDNDLECFEIAEKMGQVSDKLLLDCDLEGLKKVDEQLKVFIPKKVELVKKAKKDKEYELLKGNTSKAENKWE